MAADPQAAVVITGKDESTAAFDKAVAALRGWSDEVKLSVDSAKKTVVGFKEASEFAMQALEGFGAMRLAEKFVQIGSDIYEAASGLGEFVLEAKNAGAVLDSELIRKAEASSAAVNQMEADVMGVGAAFAGPLLDGVNEAASGISEFIRENRLEIKYLADFIVGSFAQAAVELRRAFFDPTMQSTRYWYELLAQGPKILGEMAANARQANFGRQATEGPSLAGRSDEDRARARDLAKSRQFEEFEPDEEIDSATIRNARNARVEAENRQDEAKRERDAREAERDAEKKRQAEAREVEHLNKLTQETARWYEQEILNEEIREATKLERETLKKEADLERKRLYGEQVMISTAVGYEQRLAAIEAWETRETEMVGQHEEARKRIQQKGQKDRNDLVNEERLKRLQMQAAAFGGLHSLAVSAGIKSHALEKAAVLSRAMLSLQEWKMKTAAQGGLKGFALIAAVASIAAPIISSIKGSTPFGGADTGGGGGFGGSFSVPDAPTPSLAAPSPVSQPVQAPGAHVVQYITVQGSVVTAQQIHEESLRYAEQAGADGRTTLVVRS